jgi:hypothetical protein
MFGTILLAVDGSEHSDKAVEFTKGYVAELEEGGVKARVAHKVLHLSRRPVLIAR